MKRPKKSAKISSTKLTTTLVIALVIFLVIFIFSRYPSLSEWYIQSIYPAVANILSTIAGLFPFSLYDLFILVASLYLLKQIVFALIKRTAFKDFLYSLIRFVVVLIGWFYFGWGISYFREDYYKRTDAVETHLNTENLFNFTYRFIEDANNSYVRFEVIEKNGIKQELEDVYSRLYEPLSIKYPNGNRRVKNMIFESMFTKMGISGYYGPFFNEIHVNNYSLNFTYPFTLAHEMAHQFGIAKESEANLYAFIICVNSNDERIKYSAYISTIGHLLNDAYTLLPDKYEELISFVRPEIVEDLKRNREHWLSARNETLSDVQNKAYDAYLKSNGVSSGRENYSEVVGLLISSYDNFTKSF